MRSRTYFSMFGITIEAGEEVHPAVLYPFFLIHMGMFGLIGFVMAYSDKDVPLAFMYLHGGIAVWSYVKFYEATFGIDEVKWMFINSTLGLLGIWVEIDWLLSLFGKSLDDFSPWVHVIPFLYYVLYTFLLRQMALDVFRARDDPVRKQRVEMAYIGLSLLAYGGIWLAAR